MARTAGVSLATASRALSTPQLVKPKTLARVLDAARILGYVPHGAARALASRRTHTVGLVVPTLENPIFASSTQAMQRALGVQGYQLLLASHEYSSSREIAVTRALLERGVDALVLVGTDHSPELFKLLITSGIPYVLTWSLDPSGHHDCIGFDNRKAAAQVAHYLLDQGHRRFSVISGLTHHNDRARERIAGVQEALAARGIELTADRIFEKPFSLQSGRDGLRAALALDPAPTAVVCGNDVLAQGALLQAHAEGIKVPDALSITGFDDMELAVHTPPGLTTVRIPTSAIGERVAAHVLARLNGTDVTARTELSVELVVRGSSGPAP